MSGASVVSSPDWARARVRTIMESMNVAHEDFYGKSRYVRVVECRELCAYFVYDVPGPGFQRVSWPEVAHAMGRTNHSTVLTAYRRIKATLAKEPEARTKTENELLSTMRTIRELLGLNPPTNVEPVSPVVLRKRDEHADWIEDARRMMSELVHQPGRLGETLVTARRLLGQAPRMVGTPSAPPVQPHIP